MPFHLGAYRTQQTSEFVTIGREEAPCVSEAIAGRLSDWRYDKYAVGLSIRY